jgi:hypothetical protein
MRSKKLVVLVTGLLVGLLAGAVGVSVASADPSTKPISVCTKKAMVVSATKAGKCPRGTRMVELNRRGVQGVPGPQGERGPMGPVGPAGPAGGAGAGSQGEASSVIDGGRP